MDIETFFDLNGVNIERKFVRTAIKSALDECLNQLLILRHLNIRNADSFDPFVVQYQTIEERFTGTENHAETRIPTIGTNQDKISHDINTFVTIFKEASHEIDNYGTYKILKEAIKNMKLMIRDENQILESKDKNEKLLKQLTYKCDEERLQNKSTMQRTNDKIQKIKFEVENAIAYGRTEAEFFKNYEAARIEQNNLICKTQENASLDVIKEINEKIELEMKCHKLFLEYMEEDQVDLLELIDYWVKKYDRETDSRENALLKLKGKLEYTQDMLEKLTIKFEKRQIEIEKWNDYKRMKQEKEDRIKFEITSIMRIQAWWRGTMCRRSIPPGHIPVAVKPKKNKKDKK